MHEVAIDYLAYLAYPKSSETMKRETFKLAALRMRIHRHKRVGFMTNRRMSNVLNRGFQRIRKRRLPAALMMMRKVFQNEESLRSIALPVGKAIRPRFFYDQESMRTNTLKRVWRESRGVIHMAVALRLVMQRLKIKDPLDLIIYPVWAEPAVLLAEAIKEPLDDLLR